MESLNDQQQNSDVKGKTQLFDEELEKQILGLILIDNKLFRNVEIELTENSFYFEMHKIFFKAINKMLQEDRQADEQSLYYELLGSELINNEFTKDDLKKYIFNIVSYGAGAFATPKEITRILNFFALKRKLAVLNSEINEAVNTLSIEEADEQINSIEQQIYSITNERRSQDNYSQLNKYVQVLFGKLQKARKSDKVILGVRTGLTDIDSYTGGLQKSDLIIIAARPSMGKTALATTIAKNIAEILQKEQYKEQHKKNANSNEDEDKQKAVAMFSLEMSGEQLAARIVAMDSKFSTKTIHTGRYDQCDESGNVVEANKKITDTEWNKIYQSMQDVGQLPLYIDDTPALNISVLRSRARFLKNKYNICAIIIDYLQLIRPSKSSNGNRVLEVAEITGMLKAIAKELDIPIIALSQLSRAVENSDRKDKRPQLSDLRESGTIEQDADIVMLLYREEYYMSRKEPKVTDVNDDNQVEEHNRWAQKYDKIKNLAEIIIAKNRNGPVGTITLSFDREHMLFSGFDPNQNPYGYAENTHRQIDNPQNSGSLSNSNILTNENIERLIDKNNEDNDLPDDLDDIFE